MIPDEERKLTYFYFHTSLWCLKRFSEGLKAFHFNTTFSNARNGKIKTILRKIDLDQRNMKTLLTLLLLKLIPVKRIRRYGHIMRGDINFQICEIMKVEITEKRKKGRPRKAREECIKKDLERYGLKRCVRSKEMARVN